MSGAGAPPDVDTTAGATPGAAFGRLVPLALAAVAVGMAMLLWVLFHRYNSAPEFTGRVAPDAGLSVSEVEFCRTTRGKVEVAGWAAVPGLERKRHATRVLWREDATGRLRTMHTDLPVRRDVRARLNQRLGDGIDYSSSGFAASLNLEAAGAGPGSTWLALDAGGHFRLIPLRCEPALR